MSAKLIYSIADPVSTGSLNSSISCAIEMHGEMGMDFVRARTEEQFTSRQDEIIGAGEALFNRDGHEP
jgi:hypothetical protein